MPDLKRTANIYDPIDVDAELFSKDFEFEDEVYTKARSTGGNILSILFSDETPQIMQGIGQNFRLNQNQSAYLSRIVREVLIADIFIGDIVAEIAKRLNIQTADAQSLANALLTQLFAPAIEDIKKIHREKFPDRIPKPSAATTQPSQAAQSTNPQSPPVNAGNTINLKN